MTLVTPAPHAADLGGYDFDVPLLAGDHVTDDAGTGFVHTAPSATVKTTIMSGSLSGHSSSDIPETVDEFGCYTKECPGFEGLDVIRLDGKKRGQDGKANKAVMDKLIEQGAICWREAMTTLRDAHSWRSKAPVIRRATPQWFIAMDQAMDESGKTLREKALARRLMIPALHPAAWSRSVSSHYGGNTPGLARFLVSATGVCR